MDELEPDQPPERNANGTFPPGVSGNLAGRPPKKRIKHSLPYHNARAAIEVAEKLVPITMDGVESETSAYRAVMLALANKAMSGHDRSIKLFLDQVNAASATNHEQIELVRFLLHEDQEEKEKIRKLMELFPDPGRGGVYHSQPDGSILPARWSESIKRLDALDAREDELRKRESRIAAKELELERNNRRSGG